MAKPIVAIIGRPNTGKSTLFNRLLRRRQAIVDKQEGITRDRLYGDVEWSGDSFSLIDTGGYIPDDVNVMDAAVRHQAELAMEEAHLILLMVDGREGINAIDEDLAQLVRRSNKPHLLVINKIDTEAQESMLNEFYSLGIKIMISISAINGRNTGDMLDLIVQKLKGIKISVKSKGSYAIRIAIVGMPNVGKSSVVNALLNQEKLIVTEIPGTTRDAIDTTIKYHQRTFVLVDTAGLRKKAKVRDNIEYYSMVRTFNAIDDAHLVLVILDGVKGFGRQDQQIVRRVLDNGKGMILVVNKWDLVEKDEKTQEEYKKAIRRQFKAINDYPILFISAKTRQRVTKLLPESETVFTRWKRTIPTNVLNNVLRKTVERYHPPALQGKNIKIKYITQIGTAPPRFTFFTNYPNLIKDSYKNYLENQLRAHFDLNGVPIKITFRRS